MTYKRVLLIGATGGIGQALLQRLADDESIERILATYHRRQPQPLNSQMSLKTVWLPMDITDEDSIKSTTALIGEQTPYLNWIINAAGILHTDANKPEKAIHQIDSNFFMDNMRVNALPSLLIAKHIKSLLKSGNRTETSPAIFATISARVGSINDNKVGGWYSYRMSKAALNMGMKTLSIEWQRSLLNVCVIVMQPGTVDTPLSKPYQSNVPIDALFATEACADNLLTVLNQMTATDTGSFVDWAGKSIAW